MANFAEQGEKMGGKRIIVLSGDWGRWSLTVDVKGDSSVVRSQIGLRGERPYLAVRQGCERFLSVLKDEVELPFAVTTEAHFMVVTAELDVVLYGTASDNRLWHGNMLDGFKGEILRLERESSYGLGCEKREKMVASGCVESKGEVDGRKVGKDGAISRPKMVEGGDSSETCGEAAAMEENDSAEAVEYDDFMLAESNYFEKSEYKGGTVKKSLSAFGRACRVTSLSEGEVMGVGTKRSAVVESGSRRGVVVERGEGRKENSKTSEGSFPTATFYERVKGKVAELMRSGQRIAALEELLPLTRWIKVPCEGGYYAVGTVGEPPDYICYGVPGRGGGVVPDSLRGYAKWFPLEINRPTGEGLWVMYQDARTGESVRLES